MVAVLFPPLFIPIDFSRLGWFQAKTPQNTCLLVDEQHVATTTLEADRRFQKSSTPLFLERIGSLSPLNQFRMLYRLVLI